MKFLKKAQAGIEYMIIISFVTLAIIGVLILANFYSGLIVDKIKLNQAETFSIQIINQAESVFFSGEPSEATIRLYLPDGVQNMQINDNSIIMTISTSTGENLRSFTSRVPLQGNLSVSRGIHTISIQAKNDYVLIS